MDTILIIDGILEIILILDRLGSSQCLEFFFSFRLSFFFVFRHALPAVAEIDKKFFSMLKFDREISLFVS